MSFYLDSQVPIGNSYPIYMYDVASLDTVCSVQLYKGKAQTVLCMYLGFCVYDGQKLRVMT